MKKFLLIISALVLCSTAVDAQVIRFNISVDSNSIVRRVGSSDDYLIYAENSSNDAWFILYNGGSSMAHAFKLPVGYNIQVRDVRIHDGRDAYFCGTYDGYGNRNAIVGVFRISSVFAGSGMVYLMSVGNDGSGLLDVKDLRRLELFDVDDTVCMAMVGKVDLGGQSISTVVSAWWKGFFGDVFSLHHKDIIRFTDITSLNNMVVATGSFCYPDTGCVVKTFHLTPDFPQHAYSNSSLYRFVYGHSIGDVLVTRLVRDTAVLAHFDIATGVRTLVQKTAFDVLTGAPVTPCYAAVTTPASTLPYQPSSFRMIELAYSSGTINLLHRTDYSSFLGMPPVDWRMKTNLAGLPAAVAWNPAMGLQQSMDVLPPHKTTSNDMGLLLHGPLWPSISNSCHTYIQVEKESVTVNKEVVKMYSEVLKINTMYMPVSVSVYDNIQIQLECGLND